MFTRSSSTSSRLVARRAGLLSPHPQERFLSPPPPDVSTQQLTEEREKERKTTTVSRAASLPGEAKMEQTI